MTHFIAPISTSPRSRLAVAATAGLSGCNDLDSSILDMGFIAVGGFVLFCAVNYGVSLLIATGWFDRMITWMRGVFKVLGIAITAVAVVLLYRMFPMLGDGLIALLFLAGIPLLLVGFAVYTLPDSNKHRRWHIQTAWSGMMVVALLLFLTFYARDYLFSLVF